MPNPSFIKVSETRSDPVPVSRNDSMCIHNQGDYNDRKAIACPTSTHRRKFHAGHSVTRITIVSTYKSGQKSKTFIDHVKCDFCDFEWDQEWCWAGI